MTPTPSFTVLTVCTGNICRSPAAERLLAAGLGPTVTVHSAGVGALVGHPMPVQMSTQVRAAGGDPDGFLARQIDPDMLRGADLVLALTRKHRARIVDLFPGAVRRTFTLREFARLAQAVPAAELPAADPAERLRALVPLATARRGLQVVEAAEDDVVDPYRGSDALYAESFGQLLPAVRTIVQTVVPAGAPRG